MGESYELMNWILLGVAALLGLAMGLNYLALLVARRQSRALKSEESDASGLDSQEARRLQPPEL